MLLSSGALGFHPRLGPARGGILPFPSTEEVYNYGIQRYPQTAKMDPITALGMVQTADVLAGIARNVVSNMYLYFDAVKNAPKLSAELRLELGTLCGLLDSLELALAHDQRTQCTIALTLSSAFPEFQRLLGELKARVDGAQTEGLKRLKWPFTKDENERLLSKLERFKSVFSLAMSMKCA